MNSDIEAAPIVVIEDSDEDFEVTVAAFRLANVRNPIPRCVNGRDAGNLVRRTGSFADIKAPVLVMLDLNLGCDDGRKLLQQFRQTEWLRAVPICVLSTSTNPADIRECYESGANAYLIKPVDLDRFEAMISNLTTFWFDTASLPGNFKRWSHARTQD